MKNNLRKVDLRSDTVTKPTKAMLDAMLSAPVGDDVFGDDPTVNLLQNRMAEHFQMEAALFCPSGTMTNQIALRILTQPQDEVICDQHSHIYLYEGGGMTYNSMLSPKLVIGDRGRITAQMVTSAISPDDIHYPHTSLVSIENTMNKGGGSVYSLSEIKEIRNVCDNNALKFHMDGARFFNALAVTGEKPSDYGPLFDTISICFSKGLGAPVGSVLLGSTELIKKAKRVRKVLGGGMRQAGYLAAACIYALDHHIDRLKLDHEKARIIGEALVNCGFVNEVLPVETNIVIAKLLGITPSDFLQKLAGHGVLAVGFGSDAVRFVTHLDIDENDLEHTVKVIKSL